MSTARDAEGSAAGAFARRLRELREGSGRSYGSLARRIGVSASTLHRYCSGATVPAEFAPVERLARFCGCTGDEIVALHRAWVRADAERTRRQEAAAARAAGTPEPGSRPAGPTAGAEFTPNHGRGSDAVGAPVLYGAGRDPRAGDTAPAGTPTPARTTETELGAGTDAEGGRPRGGRGPERNGAPGDTAEAAETVVLGRVRGRRPGWTGRSAVRRGGYAVGVVALSVGLVAGLVAYGNSPDRPTATAPPEGGEPVRRGEQAGGPEGTAPTTRPPARPSASAGGGPSRPAGSPPARSPRGVTGSAAGSPAATPVTGAPFTVSADDHQWEMGCGHKYLVGGGPSAVPPPPVQADAAAWAGALGAVHGGETRVRITVQGTREEAVVLHGLQVRTAARREPPRTGGVYRMDQGCGGALTPRVFEVDLDRRRPVARSVPGYGENGPIPAVSFPYRVSVRDPEVLLVTANAANCDCDWYLELEWSSPGRRGVVRIDDGGRPFRTSAIAGRPVYEYDPGARRWSAADAMSTGPVEGRGASSPRAYRTSGTSAPPTSNGSSQPSGRKPARS
ncbi:helix-turn-helix domain-containing protein [Streptomyces qinzhouensis]|uniref:Helix-turn-helix domain-containing protein n=1 Tax=Streptomyces qinzhouensis TaxID=2599401 RepID=A0A5B8JEH0_9ACTN|nr:helix-turn-helix transcriptional regulator [Streptomyces qinzhouensis]QDY79826.1 helix-turn-helix domain-containing protein [Streptomyces qinzhouensis]